MTEAVLGALTQLKLSDGASPEVYTLIAEVLRVGPVGSSAPEVDVTNLDSTAKEYIGGLDDGHTVDFDVNWIAGNTQQEVFRDGVGDTKNMQMLWPDTTLAAFAFVILGFGLGETTPEGQITASINGRITGAIVWS